MPDDKRALAKARQALVSLDKLQEALEAEAHDDAREALDRADGFLDEVGEEISDG